MTTEKALVALLMFSLLHPSAQASADGGQTCSVVGRVADTSGQPLPGVVVGLQATGLSVITDGEGRYCLPRLRTGEYLVEFSLEGFRSVTERVRVISGDRVTRDVVLHLGFREETVVTGTRTRQGLDDVPVRTEVIRRADIEASSARNLADAIEFTTGVRVENNCQNCNFSQIRLLGLDGPYTQILFDGQPTFSSLAAVYGIEQIPAGLVDRIEVVKGGGSALYGAGAVGGVVNVISREPVRTSGYGELRMESRLGLPGLQLNGGYDWVSRDRQTTFTAFLQDDRVRPVDVNGDGFTEVARRDFTSGGLRLVRHALDGRGRLTMDATRFAEDRRGGNLLRLAPHEADIAEAIETTRSSASANWFHSPAATWDYRATVSVADTSRDSYYGAGRDPNAYGATANALWLTDGQINRYWRAHTLTTGVTMVRETLDDRQPAYDRALDEVYRNVGIYLQDDWTLRKGVQLVTGVRADKHSSMARAVVSPRAALRWSPRANLDFRTSIARGFRAPQIFDEDLHLTAIGGEAVIVRHARDLREERSLNVLGGVEWKPLLLGGQALIEMNLFSTRLTDLFFNVEHPAPETQALEFLKVNLGSARVRGAEFNAGWGIGDELVIQGGIVVQRAELGAPEPDFGSREFFRSPRTYGNASIVWQVTKNTRLFAGSRYTGSMLVPYRGGGLQGELRPSRRFVTLDASISRRVRDADQRWIELVIGGRNLTNAYQEDLDRGPLRDSDYVYGPRFPRSLYASLRFGM